MTQGRKGRKVAGIRTAEEQRKAAIRSAVADARRALSSGISETLARLGVFADGKRVELASLPAPWLASAVRPAVDAAVDRWLSQGYNAAGAVERYVREASYTWLNRLAAVRALSARGLMEPVLALDPSGSRTHAMALACEVSSVLQQAGEIAEAALWRSIFEELAQRLGTLFDPLDPHAAVYPGSTAIVETAKALDQLSDAQWREDDTLGWFYQFFTTKSERAELRKKKGPSFTPDDLGPINQFYTPSWVVRFLVDNTLGALWRRMSPNTRIAEFCTLLLPATPDDTPRERKRVRDLRIIDPACGAMHFGVYAFDVLVQLYEEEGIELSRDVPRLILERNLVGIDIDRRAIQIAALNLYLKAARAYEAVGERPPRDLRMNLVCADGVSPSPGRTKHLRDRITDPLVLRGFDAALISLRSLHAVGSLIDVAADVRAELRHSVREAMPGGLSLFPGLLAQVEIPPEKAQVLDAVVSQAIALASEALERSEPAEALAAEDVALGAKVLNLVGQRYDVIVMNPPYGKLMPPATQQYLHQRYPQSKQDIYGAFFELAFRLAEGGGAIGALTSKTYLYLETFRHVRKLFLETGRIRALIDAGTGILDESFVPVGAAVAWSEPPSSTARLNVCRIVHSENSAQAVMQWTNRLREHRKKGVDEFDYEASIADLRKLPTQTLAYWAPPALLRAYETLPPLEPTYGEVRKGLATGDDARFLRYWWEVPDSEIGEGKRWVPFAKGGDYSPFYDSMLRVIDWKDGGREIIASPAARPQNRQYFFRPGITFPKVCDRFHARALEGGCIFGDGGPSIFTSYRTALLGYLNSKIAQALLLVQSPTRNFEAGQVRRLPVPPLKGQLGAQLAAIATDALQNAERYATGDELNRNFTASWSSNVGASTFRDAIMHAADNRNSIHGSLRIYIEQLSHILSDTLGFTSTDWDEILRTFGPELRVDENVKSVGSVRTSLDPLTTIEEHACRHISGVIRGLLQSSSLLREELLCAEVVQTLLHAFPTSNPLQDFAEVVGLLPSDWVRLKFITYHTQLHLGRPRILRLASSRSRIVYYADVLLLSAGDLRKALSTDIQSSERDARARSTEGHAAARREAAEVLEDLTLFRATFDEALSKWDDNCDDARERIPLFKRLLNYSVKQVS
jgi:hypothetical protein